MSRLSSHSPSCQSVDLRTYENTISRLDSPTPARRPIDPSIYEKILSNLDSRSPTRPPFDSSASGDIMSRLRCLSPVRQPELAHVQAPSTERRDNRAIDTEYVLNREVLECVVHSLREDGSSIGANWLSLQIENIFKPVVVSTTSTTFYRILKYWRTACVKDESIPERGGRLVRGIFRTFEDGSRSGYHTDDISDEDAYRFFPSLEHHKIKDKVEDEVEIAADSMTLDGDREDARAPKEDKGLGQCRSVDPKRIPQVPFQHNENKGNCDNAVMRYSATRPITISPSPCNSTPRGPSPSHHPDIPVTTTEVEGGADFFDDNDSAISLSYSATITVGGLRQTIHFDPDDRAAVMQRIDEYLRFCRSGNDPHVINYNAFAAVRDFTLARLDGSRK